MQYEIDENVLNVETEEFEPDPDFNNKATLKVETKKLKTCHVCVRLLEDILREEAKEDQPKPVNDLPSGEHFTCSRTRKPAIRTGHMPARPVQANSMRSQLYHLHPKRKNLPQLSQRPVVQLHLAFLPKTLKHRTLAGDYHQLFQTATVKMTIHRTNLCAKNLLLQTSRSPHPPTSKVLS